jgi:predicted alpha/beta hydrolase family esterase
MGSKLNFSPLKEKIALARAMYKDFRLYDLGTYAVNNLISKTGYRIQAHVAYGDKLRQHLDLYVTDTPRQGQPLIVFVHGGAWSHGDKKDYRFVGEVFAKQGFDVAIINYHLAPHHIFPSSIDDLSLALNYLHAHQVQHHISTQNLVLMGHSAGAFNVMSALYHPIPYRLNCRQNIRAVIGLAGPYHFDYKGDPLCADAFDQEIHYSKVMPYYFVESNQIQHYLFMAANDTIVHPKNATDFDQELKAKGNHSQIVIVPRTGHISVMGSIAPLFSRYFSTQKQILAALDQALA